MIGDTLCLGTCKVRVALHPFCVLASKTCHLKPTLHAQACQSGQQELPQVNYVSLSVATADSVVAQTGTGDAVSALVRIAVVFLGQHEHLPSFAALL